MNGNFKCFFFVNHVVWAYHIASFIKFYPIALKFQSFHGNFSDDHRAILSFCACMQHREGLEIESLSDWF